MSSLDVCVVGGGITGLSAAVNVQKLISHANVTVIADSFGTDTNTPVTRSIFLPFSGVQGVNRDWLIDGWNHHFTKAKNCVEEDNGHCLMTGYYLWSDGEEPIFAHAVFNYHQLSPTELAAEDFPSKYKYGCRFTTVLVDLNKYLRYLMKDFRQRGGNVLFDTVYSLQELYGKYDIVINCTGMRARELVADPDLVCRKGHVVRVRNEAAKNFLITDDEISIVPHDTDAGIVDIGYLWEPGIYTPGPMRNNTMEVLQRARDLVPFLEDCGVVKVWAEKRPERHKPLVEIEMLRCGRAILPLVHNIALGRETLTMAWGTGVHVAHLVQDIKRKIKSFAHVMLPYKTLI